MDRTIVWMSTLVGVGVGLILRSKYGWHLGLIPAGIAGYYLGRSLDAFWTRRTTWGPKHQSPTWNGKHQPLADVYGTESSRDRKVESAEPYDPYGQPSVSKGWPR